MNRAFIKIKKEGVFAANGDGEEIAPIHPSCLTVKQGENFYDRFSGKQYTCRSIVKKGPETRIFIPESQCSATGPMFFVPEQVTKYLAGEIVNINLINKFAYVQ